ncbi:MAG: acyl-CoA dehydrogenase family protein, partial [Acidimicrobiales bacterium]
MTADETDAPDERAVFRAEVQAFLQASARPRGPASLWTVGFHTDEKEQAEAFNKGRSWQRTLFDHDLAGLTYPVEYGGRGGQPWHEAIYRQEAAGYAATSGFVSSTIAMLAPTLMQWGTEEQRRKLLPRLFSAEDTYCQLFSEPGAGSDLAGLSTRASRDGDEFIISGQKVWSSAAQFCTRGMLLVRSDPDAVKHRGVTFILVDMDSPGIETHPLVQATGGREFNEVFFDEVRIPVANIVGEVNRGWDVARTVMANEAAFIGSGGDATPPHVRLRALAEHFGRTADPLIRQELAAAYTRDRILRLLGDRMRGAAAGGPRLDPALLKLAATQNRVRSG